MLIMILCKMETMASANDECIVSFRVEVLDEWKVATGIKHRLVSLITSRQDKMGQSAISATATTNSTPASSSDTTTTGVSSIA
jgi:hypothetical protein